MQRPIQHEIDQQSKTYLEATLPSSWVIVEQRPDYGKDYLVDVVEDGQLTGLNFFVQLKGTTCPSLTKDGAAISFKLERKHALYYSEKVLQPVMLVVVDVPKKLGYWVFLQRYLHNALRGQPWKGKKSVTVRVPTENLLSNTARLKAEVAAATAYMAAQHPVSIEAAIKAQKARLERKDRRFQIQVLATEKGQLFALLPKEPVELQITFLGEQHKLDPKFVDLFDRGLPVSFQADEVRFAGSPLIEEIWKNGGTLDFGTTLDATVDLIARDTAGVELARVSIPGHVTGGSQEQRFEGELPRAPLKFYATTRRNTMDGPLRIAFDVRRWHGQPVTMLAYFDKIATFLKAIRGGARLCFECLLDGNLFFAGYAPPDLPPQLYRNADIVAVLGRAREIARLQAVTPNLPDDFGPKHAEEIERLHALLTTGQCHEPSPDYTITVGCSADAIRKILAESRNNGEVLGLRSEGNVQLPFLGLKVDVGMLEHIVTEVAIVGRKSVEQEVRLSNEEIIRVRFVTSPNSIHTTHRVSND